VPRQFAHVSRSVNMEWGFKENHVAVIALQKSRKSDSQIFKLLKPLKISSIGQLNVIRNSGVIKDRARSGCLKSVRAEATIKTVQERIRRNPLLETEDHVPRAEHIDPIRSCLIRDDLHMKAHLRSKGHLLAPALKEIRRTRAEHLLQWHADNGHENILFTDEKFFTIEEQYNNQNNKIYAQMSLEVHSEGAGMPSPILHHGLMGGVPSGGDTSSFLHERSETGVRPYQEDVLQGVVKQLNMTLFSGQKWVFQQDSFPAQKPRQLRSGCGGTFWPRIGPQRVQTSTPGTINCGLFWRT